MSRKNQLWALIILSACTMAIPYAVQGTLAMASCPGGLDWWMCAGDKYAWSIRAIVEGVVIGYIASTRAQTKQQTRILWIFKAALLLLIAGTLGPSLYATATKQTVPASLNNVVLWLWMFGLAAYMPLMVAGAAYAYKVQSGDDFVINLTTRIETLTADLESTRLELQVANEQVRAVEAWGLLTPTAQVRLIKSVANGDAPPPAKMAEALGISKQTVYRAGKDSR